jgi:hypothetical protein
MTEGRYTRIDRRLRRRYDSFSNPRKWSIATNTRCHRASDIASLDYNHLVRSHLCISLELSCQGTSPAHCHPYSCFVKSLETSFETQDLKSAIAEDELTPAIGLDAEVRWLKVFAFWKDRVQCYGISEVQGGNNPMGVDLGSAVQEERSDLDCLQELVDDE